MYVTVTKRIIKISGIQGSMYNVYEQMLTVPFVQVCLSAEMAAEQWASVPTASRSAAETLHTWWASTGRRTRPGWSGYASSRTEPCSSCVCQRSKRSKVSSNSRFTNALVFSLNPNTWGWRRFVLQPSHSGLPLDVACVPIVKSSEAN